MQAVELALAGRRPRRELHGHQPEEKQEILETFDLQARLDKVLELLAHRIEVLKLSREIGEQTKDAVEGRQREHLLREQLRTIQKELGEAEGTARRDRRSSTRRSPRPACPRRSSSRRARS